MEGLNHYFSDKNLSAEAEMISIPPVRMLAPSFVKVKKFIQEGLAGDWPVGFLNLHSGGEPIPYHWHWMILVRMEEAGGRTICTLWDEGKAYPFDLEKWLHATLFGGGFVRVGKK